MRLTVAARALGRCAADVASTDARAGSRARREGGRRRWMSRRLERGARGVGDGDAGETRRAPTRTTRADAVALAVGALRRGGVIAVPTDTIYGFAARAEDGAAVRRLYEIKGRKATVAVAIAVGDVGDIGRYGECSHLREGLLGRILPGPVTVLLRRRASEEGGASSELNPGVDLIGIRVPASDFVREVCRAHGSAIALTSANRSGETSTTSVEEFAELWDACAEVFDGGVIETKRLGSTIVDLSSTDGRYGVVREGEKCAELLEVLEREFSLMRR